MAKGRQTTMDQFGIAESLGEIKTLPFIEEKAQEEEQEVTLIDNPEDFRMAIGQAQMNGEEFVEVSEKLFKYLVKNAKTPYLTYGDPGIKVYLKGTREKLEREDRMSADQYAEYIGKQSQQNL